VLVAVPAAIVAVGFVNLGGLPWALFMLAIALVCLHELYRMLSRWRPAPVVGFASAAAMILAAHFGTSRDVLEIAVATLPVAFLAVIASGRAGTPTVSIGGTMLGVYWIGLPFAHAVLLRQVDHGNAILIDVMVGTFLGDSGAYLGGRLFGRRPLAPEISPNKTVEGLVCGMFVAILSVFVAGLYETWMTQGDSLLLGLAVAVLGPLGDLFESLFKRDAGAKDAGRLFGAHGGALDRMDAIIFTVVAAYYVWISVMH
jgi:phosphatidate cytidylyltransferase